MSTLLRPVRIRCRRHVSPYYVVVAHGPGGPDGYAEARAEVDAL